MSKFTEEWQKLRADMGNMVGIMDSMAVKYGECTNLEEHFYNKGLVKGREEGLRKNKEEICKGCEHKVTSELSCKYTGLLREFDRLSYSRKEIVEELIDHFNGRKK